MNISYNWLRDYINVDLPAEEVADLLTFIGLEVEGLKQSGNIPEGLVVGEVMRKEKHPNADRLSLTHVNTGRETVPVVCGAPNVAAGQKVVFAPVGCTLQSINGEKRQIKKRKIRGCESMGMICAEDEIGLGNSHDGIMVLDGDLNAGTPVKEVLTQTADTCFEIGLTPNRADAHSHFGVARDLYAVLKIQRKDQPVLLKKPAFEFPGLSTNNCIDVKVEDTGGCPRYCGITIKGVDVDASPEWLRKRLQSIGLNPHNNIVDVANFVMWACGQPLHPFDADKIHGGVFVKKLPGGTEFTTLDGVARKLHDDDLMICDAQGGLCIAGVFGGLESGISEKTQNVFLESAYFDPAHIRRTSKRHGLQTDASFRFERGVDPNNTMWALQRAATMICSIAGGKPGGISDTRPEAVPGFEIDFDLSYCDRLTGISIPRQEVIDILDALDIEVEEGENNHLKLLVPPYRVDVTRPADVVEEVLRIYGYNLVAPSSNLSFQPAVHSGLDAYKQQERATMYFNALGFTEIMNNSLTDSSYYEKEGWQEEETVMLKNPGSRTLNAMRQSMVFGGMETIRYNLNRQMRGLRLFEWGKTYKRTAKSGFVEDQHLAVLLYESHEQALWQHGKKEIGFYDLKEVVYGLIHSFGLEVQEEALDDSQFEYGLSAICNDVSLVSYGLISEGLRSEFELKSALWYADIDWAAWLRAAETVKTRHESIPQYPSVRRDLSLLLNKDITYSTLEGRAYAVIPEFLEKVDLFDVYEGKNLPSGKKSYAMSFIFRNYKGTLRDETVDAAMKRLINSYSELGAALR